MKNLKKSPSLLKNIKKEHNYMKGPELSVEEERRLFDLWKKGRERAIKKHRKEMQNKKFMRSTG